MLRRQGLVCNSLAGHGLLVGARAMILILCGVLLVSCWSRPALAEQEYGTITTRLVKIITSDDSGQPLGFPSLVLFDPVYKETYVYASNQRITIYNQDFFPLGSIGAGRGLQGVNGMALGPQGELFVASSVKSKDGSQGSVIAVYNRALLFEREIAFNKIPALTGFMAQDLAVAADGTMYVVGYISGQEPIFKGAAILDNMGNFKRWLAPQSLVQRRQAPEVKSRAPLEKEPPELEENGLGDDLPDSVKPSRTAAPVDDGASRGSLQNVEAPVGLDCVRIDLNGRIYLLSTETSETYVYDSKANHLYNFGYKGGAKGKLSTPRSLAIDYPRRLIYVCDYMRHTILAYDYDSGQFVYEFGGKGFAPLWYLHPQSLAVDSLGRVIIADLFNHRVQVVDPSNPERPILAPIVPAEVLAGQGAGALASPALSVQLAGIEVPVQMAGAAFPEAVPLGPPREITPARVKKKIAVELVDLVLPDPLPALAPIGPVAMPAPIAPPPGFAVDSLAATKTGAGREKAVETALRAVLGVYGPVAAVLGVGNWLRHRGR